ncbi:MAG TPA: HNH endonuclease signature motif containing protein [Gemmatimonadales bacterium]
MLARDGHACQWPISHLPGDICGKPARNVDHIVPAHISNNDDESNLWSLCDHHTRRKDSSEGGRAAWRNRPRRKRPPEPHPGVI